ncbi:MAG: hypothetical protein ACI8QC_000859 [Planctomycetota bacterium]|jgi:hypothetical protein
MSALSDPNGICITSSLPKVWEQEESFNDVLFDWLSRAPWIGLSAAAHLVIFLVLSAIPWNLFDEPEEVIIISSIEHPETTEFVDPPEEKPEEVSEDEPEDEPVIQDSEITDESDVHSEDDFMESTGDPDLLSDSPFEDEGTLNLIGIGGNAGGKYGHRFGQGDGRGGKGGRGTHEALENGLRWLVNHQSPAGYWDVGGFMHNHSNKTSGCDCEDAGEANQNVGVTGLCLLALLGDGSTTLQGKHKRAVQLGVRWLLEQQDYETGLIGEAIGHSFLYDHSIASLALTEASHFSHSPSLRSSCTKAIRYIEKARNPYGAWRYDVPPVGDNDTSVTGWMVFALKSAEESGIKVDREAYAGALGWLDQVTDPANGRVGYDQLGSESSRVAGVNEHFPTDTGEAMTSVGLLLRFFMGQDPDDTPAMKQHADLLLRKLPEWDPEGLGSDMYYWYYGSYAMYQMGGKHWDRWNRALKPAVLGSQRQDGHARGSWDPIGPWGYSGGRVYSTALMVLCLEVYFRYSRVLGGR